MNKCLLLVALLPLAAFAATVEGLPSLPTGVLPNSEVVTNVVLDVDFNRIEFLIKVR